MRRCFVVANAMGRKETLSKLIPYLAEHVAGCGTDGENGSDGNPGQSSSPTQPSSSGESSLSPSNIGDGVTSDEDDEILLILAEQLGQMVLAGLIPARRSTSILPILERLAGVEETVVRDKAVMSINAIIPLLARVGGDDEQIDKNSTPGDVFAEEAEARTACMKNAPVLLLAMVRRLSGAEWFTSRVSACGILPEVYRFFQVQGIRKSGGSGRSGTDRNEDTETKRMLRMHHKELCEDETPMVRRGAAKNLGRFVEAVSNLPSGILPATPNNWGDDGPTPLASSEPEVSSTIETHAVVRTTVAASPRLRDSILVEEIVPTYMKLAKDEQDSVRLLAVVNSGSIGLALGLDGVLSEQWVLPIVKAGSVDLSWRVRHRLAKNFSAISISQGYRYDNTTIESDIPTSLTDVMRLDIVLRSFAALLSDAEAEVRASAVENVARMARIGGSQLFRKHVVPVLPALAEDVVVEVRARLARTVMECCGLEEEEGCGDISKSASVGGNILDDATILNNMRPLLERFLRDEFAEVQLHVLTRLGSMSRLLGQMTVVVDTVVPMASSVNWRVREAVGKILPHLAAARGVSYFEEDLLTPWMGLLLDRVAEVRSACVEGTARLVATAGPDWIREEVLPRYGSIYDESTSYLSRIAVLRSYSSLISGKDGEKHDEGKSRESIGGSSAGRVLIDDVVDKLLRGLDDRVANVRMVAAKALADVSSECGDGLLNTRVKPALNARVDEDEDEDCKEYAKEALLVCASV